MLGAAIAQWMGTDMWLILSAFGVAGPWIQALGRLRCLVQGCCHGRPSPDIIGIRYTHPRSRVTRLAQLAGESLHPTPLYSIAWNILLGLFMARLWQVHTPLPVIPGVYLILSGIGRFVEECYRGEPQTPVVAGLRLYQWMAIGSVLGGALMTTAQTDSPWPNSALNLEAIGGAALLGFITWFALGVDFPNSNRRFSRLT
jgi:prolipoprotein diacylglyceryltransferase